MTQQPKPVKRSKFNYTKWGFIVGTSLAMATLVVSLTVPEFRCFLGLKSESCGVKLELVEIITETEGGEPLDGVEIRFSSQGAPELQYTDDNGFASVKIPSKGDVKITFSKTGYENKNLIVNLLNEQSRQRVVRLTELAVPKEQTVVPDPGSQNPSEPDQNDNKSDKSVSHSSSPAVASTKLTKTNCTSSGRVSFEDNQVSISKQLFTSIIYMVYDKAQMTCEIFSSSDKQFSSLSLTFGISDGNSCPVASPVKFYLDGEEVKEYELKPGLLKETELNVTGVKNFAIEFQGAACSNNGGVHFVDATLR